MLEIPQGQRARRSLEQVGIRIYERVRVLRAAPLGGPVLIEVGGSRVALGRSLARRIKVRPIGSH